MFEILYTILTQSAAVGALVDDRIYPLEAPQDAPRPYVVYRMIDTETVRALGGDTLLERGDLEITITAADFDEGLATQAAVIGALNDQRHINDIVRQFAYAGSDNDVIRPASGQEFGVFEFVIDFDVWFLRGAANG